MTEPQKKVAILGGNPLSDAQTSKPPRVIAPQGNEYAVTVGDSVTVLQGSRNKAGTLPMLRKSFRYTGAVPKGHSVFSKRLTFEKQGYELSVTVEIMHNIGTKRGILKKMNHAYLEITAYLDARHIDQVLKEGRFSARLKF